VLSCKTECDFSEKHFLFCALRFYPASELKELCLVSNRSYLKVFKYELVELVGDNDSSSDGLKTGEFLSSSTNAFTPFMPIQRKAGFLEWG
jgi:hypothetical protein